MDDSNVPRKLQLSAKSTGPQSYPAWDKTRREIGNHQLSVDMEVTKNFRVQRHQVIKVFEKKGVI